MYYAVEENHEEVIRLLLAEGADVHVKDKQGRMPLHCAMSAEVVSLLVAKGAEVNAKDNEGSSPLHYASIYSYDKEAVRMLISKGANINAETANGETPLYWVEEIREESHEDTAYRKEVASLLREYGANKDEVSFAEEKASAKRATTLMVVLILVVSIIVIWTLFKY